MSIFTLVIRQHLKPLNLLISSKRQLKQADFGLASVWYSRLDVLQRG